MVDGDWDDLGLARMEQQLGRGVLVLAVLSQLRAPQYGYSLRQALGEGGMPVEEGTLYPLLRRLEGQGLLASEWDTSHAPPRRYYRLNAAGRKVFAALAEAWRRQADAMGQLLDEGGRDEGQ